MTIDLVQQVLAALERERVRYVIFGAVALALHGLPRATEKETARPKDHVDAARIAQRFGIKED